MTREITSARPTRELHITAAINRALANGTAAHGYGLMLSSGAMMACKTITIEDGIIVVTTEEAGENGKPVTLTYSFDPGAVAGVAYRTEPSKIIM